MKITITTAAAAIGAALLAPAAANAQVAVSSTAFGLNDTPAGSTVIDFDTPLPAGFTLTGGNVRNFSDGAGAEPAVSNGVKETSFYLTANAGNPATITSLQGYRTLSLYWGSIDTYNTLTLLDQAGMVIKSFAGNDIWMPANGDQGAGSTNRRVNFQIQGATSPIYGVRFASTSPAFEVDNVAFSGAVPEPATWAMMIMGFGLVGAAMRRGQRASEARFARKLQRIAAGEIA